MLADREPKPDVPTSVRPIAEPIRVIAPAVFRACSSTDAQPVPPPAAIPPPPAKARTEPLGAERYRVQFTADRETHAQLEELRALMRHQIPDGDVGKILAKAIASLLKQVRKQKFAETSAPDAPRSTRARIRHDISPPRSGEQSGSATRAAAPTSRKAAGAATRESSSNSTTRTAGNGRDRTRSKESRCAVARTISCARARTSARNTWPASRELDLNPVRPERAAHDDDARDPDAGALGPRSSRTPVPGRVSGAAPGIELGPASTASARIFGASPLPLEQPVQYLRVMAAAIACGCAAASGPLVYADAVRDGVAGVSGIDQPAAIAISPDGAQLYVAGSGANAVAIFARDADSGALAPAGVVRDGRGVQGLDQPGDVAISRGRRARLRGRLRRRRARRVPAQRDNGRAALPRGDARPRRRRARARRRGVGGGERGRSLGLRRGTRRRFAGGVQARPEERQAALRRGGARARLRAHLARDRARRPARLRLGLRCVRARRVRARSRHGPPAPDRDRARRRRPRPCARERGQRRGEPGRQPRGRGQLRRERARAVRARSGDGRARAGSRPRMRVSMPPRD